jgi:hypothetical protein
MIAWLSVILVLAAAVFAALMRELRLAPSSFPGPDGRSRDTGVRAGEPCQPAGGITRGLADWIWSLYQETDVQYWARMAREDPAGVMQHAARRLARAMPQYLAADPWQDDTGSFAAFCGQA